MKKIAEEKNFVRNQFLGISMHGMITCTSYIYIYKLSIYKNLWSMSPWCGIYFHDPIALLVTPQVHYSDPFGGTLQASLFKREPCRT